MKRKLIILSLPFTLLCEAGQCQKDASAFENNMTLEIASNYIDRGITQTQDQPSVSGSLETKFHGLKASISSGNVSFKDSNAQFELVPQLAYTQDFTNHNLEGSVTVGVQSTLYPNSDAERVNEFHTGFTLDKLSFSHTINADNSNQFYSELGWEHSFENDFSLHIAAGIEKKVGNNLSVSLTKNNITASVHAFEPHSENKTDKKEQKVVFSYAF